ncbi:Cadmium, cobalt and zinc/H(+)-K(+) antiporter [Posidoniimonas polymericola]|uniref:Cadmium, cobalt and zinc/H(+)-K(+) antiporter n=1 Tax=Posidoniimonas polymericola TaxID=2528002 RepID=A0A5C5YTI5_9BACT|nr:cation diffusion facilitator family transporter [Posidoniimonas polymericola]TWT78285.1 Cadmium, cobalt and zinc/H(+)-K(+) antiporter [Posidoniimonas polymericola]
MAQDHSSHDHAGPGQAGHGHSHDAGANLGVAFGLNLLFTLLEIAGGLYTNSVAILSDALHDAGDCLSLGLAWRLQKLSAKQADARFTYGYQRFSSLGALITGVVLIVGLGFVAVSAISRLREPAEVNAPGMVAFAVVGVLMNGFAAWKLHGGHSLNERVATWHLLEDTLGWVAVLIGSIVMTCWDLPIIDPLMAILISLFVLYNVFRNLKQVAAVFLQSAPRELDAELLQARLRDLPGVVASHHTHAWTLDGESHVVSTHLVLDAASTRADILRVKQGVHKLLAGLDVTHVAIDVELEGESCPAEG